MKKTVLLLCLLTLAFIQAVHAQSLEDVYKRIEALIAPSQVDESARNQLMDLLDSQVRAHPENARLRKYRLDQYMAHKRLRSGKAEADALYGLTGDPSMRYLSCLMGESLQGTGEDAIACYREVYQGIKDQPASDLLMVLAASMGEAPDAEGIRQRYLATFDNKDLREWAEFEFVPFDRKRFLLENVE